MTRRIGTRIAPVFSVVLLLMSASDARATKWTHVIAAADVYQYDGTSVSSIWDDSNAADTRHSTAFADYGVLKVTGEASMLGWGATGGRADATAEWWDNVVFTNASLTGQNGTATVTISLAGTLVENPIDNVRNLGAYASVGVQASTATAFPGGWILNKLQAGPADAPVSGTYTLEIPVVFGTPLDLHVRITGTAIIHVLQYYGGGTGTCKFDLGNSLYWGGVSKVVDGNGVEVPFTVTSESGHNWALSSVPGAVVAGGSGDGRDFLGGGTCTAAPGRGSDALSGAVGVLTLLSPMAWLWAARRRERRNR